MRRIFQTSKVFKELLKIPRLTIKSENCREAMTVRGFSIEFI
jgi:hypothetical protein